MWHTSETLPLPENVFTILRDLIHDRTGQYFDAGKRELLAEKLSAQVIEKGLSSFLDYYYLLKYGPNSDQEWLRVLDALSVQESYFWREIGQIRALVEEILPAFTATHPHVPIRIWSAACATGEEPLSISMALLEGGWFERAPIRILASDASPAAIRRAQNGVYQERSFRALPKSLQLKYFKSVPRGWQVAPEVAAHVSFSMANLRSEEDIESLVQVPFVFCRNVFIYFSRDAVTRTLQQFARKMPRPGYLFVGASESLLRLSTEFELESVGDAFVYTLK